jgi:invasion protein IalB
MNTQITYFVGLATRLLRFSFALFLLLLLTFSMVAQAGPKVGDKFGAWTFSCKAIGPGETKCGLAQNVIFKRGGKPVFLSVTVAYNDSNNVLSMALKTPLYSYLTSGISMSIDSGYGKKVPFQQCKKGGCIGVFKINKKFRNALILGRTLKTEFKVILNKVVYKVPGSISLRGMAKGLVALDGGKIPLGEEKVDKYQYPVF